MQIAGGAPKGGRPLPSHLVRLEPRPVLAASPQRWSNEDSRPRNQLVVHETVERATVAHHDGVAGAQADVGEGLVGPTGQHRRRIVRVGQASGYVHRLEFEPVSEVAGEARVQGRGNDLDSDDPQLPSPSEEPAHGWPADAEVAGD